VQRSLATVPQGHAFGVCGPAVGRAAVVEVLEALGGT
jgi:Na+-transporting NADH:ubiquinone oxidoreductase subunit NqrF